jgi:threonylcarbamoyladenosine tRNA methylthiotransferase CDKAL1
MQGMPDAGFKGKPKEIYWLQVMNGQKAGGYRSPGRLGELSGKDVHILTYGCTFNAGDTRKLEGILASQGCRIVDSADTADVVVVNTCTVVGRTERKMLRVMKRHRDRTLYVTGCMSVVQKEEILSVCDPVFIHPEEISAAYRSCCHFPDHDFGIVQIGRGCLGSCRYCITKFARGPLVSFPEEEIVHELRKCIRSGVAEIRLTAQDCSAWGRDHGQNLAGLLEKLGGIRGNFCIRVGMMNPDTITPILDPLVYAFRHQNIFRFIHIPVQSGSARVLQKMGRRYTADDVLEIIGAFRKKFPDITIATDIITGYPGEEDEDFKETLALLHKMRPAKVNHTRYSRRPGTSSAEEKDMPDYAKKVRSRQIQQHAEELCHILNRSLIGGIQRVRVTEKVRPGSVLSRTDTYTGILLPENLPIGTIHRARIIEDRIYYLTGERIC